MSGAADTGTVSERALGSGAAEDEQLALVRARPKRRASPPARLAVDRPIARVVVDVALPHLDHPFDYSVTEALAATATPGVRVRVRFAGQDVDGFVVERLEASEHRGRLSPLRRVVSAEPVLRPDVLRVARLVADRWAGSLSDVLRLAVPPRHARAENERAAEMAPGKPAELPAGGGSGAAAEPARTPHVDAAIEGSQRWGDYEHGPELLALLAAGGSPRAVWAALPGPDPVSRTWPRWPGDLAVAVHACVASGRGALVLVPDRRDVALVAAAVDSQLGPRRHTALTADLGPTERYRRWLSVLRGTQRVVVGTRSAAFAPVADLGLVAIWDDGDDLHAEPRAPYPHAREVLRLRAEDSDAAMLVGGRAVTAEGAELVRSGWARAVGPTRAATRSTGPLVRVAGDDGEGERHAATSRTRLPGLAFDTARAALAAGPVLVQVPRSGYLPSLACGRCRTPARCASCRGPLRLGAIDTAPACWWCGRRANGWRCPECTWPSLRAPVVGAIRTAEEIGRAFPSVPVIQSGGDRVVTSVGTRPALVVATPGAEPVAAGGYAAALLLDGWALLGRADLRAGEEALRRWLGAVLLVRSAGDGGRVVLMAPPGASPAQALVRADPFGAAERELADRASAGFPPATSVATILGDASAVAELLALAALPDGTDVLGPVHVADNGPAAEEHQYMLRTGRSSAPALAAALKAAVSVRSARKLVGVVRVQIDPVDLG